MAEIGGGVMPCNNNMVVAMRVFHGSQCGHFGCHGIASWNRHGKSCRVARQHLRETKE